MKTIYKKDPTIFYKNIFIKNTNDVAGNNFSFKFLKDILLNRENFQNWSHTYTHTHTHTLTYTVLILLPFC